MLRTGREEVVIGDGLEPGERVAVSPLPQVIDNMVVTIEEPEATDSEQ